MPDNPVYFLSSLEYSFLEQVRKCKLVKKITLNTGKVCAIAKIDPPILGQTIGLTEDLEKIIITHRHEGDNVYNIKEFPCFVFVCTPTIDDESKIKTKNELKILGWGEIYRSYSDAKNHVFD